MVKPPLAIGQYCSMDFGSAQVETRVCQQRNHEMRTEVCIKVARRTEAVPLFELLALREFGLAVLQIFVGFGVLVGKLLLIKVHQQNLWVKWEAK